MLKLTNSIRLLSSGTIATLINESSYKKIEDERNNFFNFSKNLPSQLTWQKAWKLYINSK